MVDDARARLGPELRPRLPPGRVEAADETIATVGVGDDGDEPGSGLGREDAHERLEAVRRQL
jgi:hypothetical protein